MRAWEEEFQRTQSGHEGEERRKRKQEAKMDQDAKKRHIFI